MTHRSPVTSNHAFFLIFLVIDTQLCPRSPNFTASNNTICAYRLQNRSLAEIQRGGVLVRSRDNFVYIIFKGGVSDAQNYQVTLHKLSLTTFVTPPAYFQLNSLSLTNRHHIFRGIYPIPFSFSTCQRWARLSFVSSFFTVRQKKKINIGIA